MAQPPMFYQRSPDYESNMRIARELMATPVQGRTPIAGLADAGQRLVGAWIARQEKDKETARQKEYSTALAQALQAGEPWRNPDTSAMPSMNAMERDATMGGGDGRRYLAPGEVAQGTGGQRAMIAALMGNEMTAPLGTQMQFQELQNRRETERQLALERAKPVAPVRLRPGETAINPRTGETMFTAPPARGQFTIDVGPNKVTYIGDETDPSTWRKVGEAPRFAPAAPQRETWNPPVPVMIDGKPAMVQYSNTGGYRVVDGASPYAAPGKTPEQIREEAKARAQGTAEGTPERPLNIDEMIADAVLRGDTPKIERLVAIKRSMQNQTTANVNVTTGGEGSYLKEAGKFDAGRRDAIFAAGDAANERLGTTRQMIDLLVSADNAIATGSLQGVLTSLQGVAADLGFDMSALAKRASVNLGSLSTKQEFRRLSNVLARELSSELKGNLSDRDVVFLRDSLAGLGRDEEANALALAAMEVASRRSAERADLLREREERDGVSLPTLRNFEREWNQYIRENSIVDQVKARAEEIAAQRRAAVPEAPPRVVGAGNPPPFSQGSQTPYADMSTDDLMRRAFGGR